MRLKQTASIRGLSPEMLVALIAATSAYESRGYDCVVTSGVDSRHSYGSLHYSGQALDFRTRHVDKDRLNMIVSDLQDGLGQDFDVVLESDHLHIEYQPKVAL